MAEPSSSRMKPSITLGFLESPPTSKEALYKDDVVVISDVEEENQDPLNDRSSSTTDDQQTEDAQADELELRQQVQEIVEVFGADIKRALLARRQNLEEVTRTVIKDTSEKIDHIWVIQHEHRQNLHLKYSLQFSMLFQQWDAEEEKFQAQEAKLASTFQEQQKNLQQAVATQNQTLRNMKLLYEQFTKKLEDLEKDQESCFIGKRGELKREIDAWRESIIKEAQRQELGIIQKSLNSLLF